MPCLRDERRRLLAGRACEGCDEDGPAAEEEDEGGAGTSSNETLFCWGEVGAAEAESSGGWSESAKVLRGAW